MAEKNRKVLHSQVSAQRDVRVSQNILYVVLAGVEGEGAKPHTPEQRCQGRLQVARGVRLSFMGFRLFCGRELGVGMWENCTIQAIQA